ncbi:DUF3667 domain-containing protein [Pseudoxanthomonas daejeonensis]|uniref:DUF3667 domain-containing protein n=1 Tax=Pseudoxanthomonas daejeonensis TaxID=266062 RepID=A0ABQ6Z7S0_9GAMM|nr:DUF3667 domain-containing protein [Pseudoxanthomonas daejeonensis]KAF1695099.1 hypothetical protein CSC65_07755 [Pseudoxanthomonas daejeonensis]
MSDHPTAACENCAAPLQGAFCHACGQAAHSPVRSFTHAVEEVFESFWHLDGRIFRTMRRLLSPGALARDYLAGMRAPYVAPMRLFVILCVLTFFVGRLVDFGDAFAPTIDVENAGMNEALSQATSIAEVEKIRDSTIANLEQARAELPATLAPARAGFDHGIGTIRRQADRRIRELGGTPAARADVLPSDALVISTDAPPGTWLEHQASRLEQGWRGFLQNPAPFKAAFMGSVPTVLFMLVPIFALLLKLFYVGTGRMYLEHLVVALYSHAFLCVALLGQFALLALDHGLSPHLAATGVVTGLISALLWLWMPAYLLLMQKRVYAQGWLLTTLKFMVLGSAYATMLFFTAVALALVSLART